MSEELPANRDDAPEPPEAPAPAYDSAGETERVRRKAADAREEFFRTRRAVRASWADLMRIRERFPDRDSQLAALNLLEDTEQAQRARQQEALERWRAQELSLTSQARLHLAMEAANLGSFVWDIEADRGNPDDRMLALLGLPRGFGISLQSALATLIHPGDRDRYASELTRAVDPSSDGKLRTEVRVRLPSGAVRWLAITARVFFDGEPRRAMQMSGVAEDVTERKAAEEELRQSRQRLQLIIENAREYAIFSMDLERRITSWSHGARKLLGYTEEEALGCSGDIIFTPQDQADGAPAQEEATAIRAGQASDERWHVRKNGEVFWGSGVMTAMRDVNGAAMGLLKIFRDHTAERLAREKLEQSLAETLQAQAEAEAAAQAKDHFLAVLSHELRTPLTPVLLAVEIISRFGGQNEIVRQAVETIRANIAVESRFINDLLDVTRIGHGKLEMILTPLDLHEVIRRAVTGVQTDFNEKQQELTVTLEAADVAVSGDGARLQQVVWNLLKNAAKFTGEEGRIRMRTFNEPGAVILEVTDSGIGIDPAELPVIFDAFAQANQSITKTFGGLGLGLAIAKGIVDGHGGQMQAESAGRDQGATFRVRIPLLNQSGPSPG